MFSFSVKNSPKVNGHEMVEVHCEHIPRNSIIYEIIEQIADKEYRIRSETSEGSCRALKYVNCIETIVASTDFPGGSRTNIGEETSYLPTKFSFRMPKFLLNKKFLETELVYCV